MEFKREELIDTLEYLVEKVNDMRTQAVEALKKYEAICQQLQHDIETSTDQVNDIKNNAEEQCATLRSKLVHIEQDFQNQLRNYREKLAH